jgi:ATP-binding cassette subfamily B protein
MIRHWLSSVSRSITTIGSMIALTWQARSLYFVGFLVILMIQGMLPLATAWVLKLLLDALSQGLLQKSPPALWHYLIVLLSLQAGVMLVSQLINPINQYLNAELGRQISLRLKTALYQQVGRFAGLAYFEDSHFHNTIQLAANGAQATPIQLVGAVASLLQGITTLVTFLGVLLPFNPLLAGIVGVAVLPQLYIQLKFGRQRFGVASLNSQKERRASYYGQVLSWTAFAKEIRLFNLADYFLNSFIRTTQEIHHTQRVQQQRELRWQFPLAALASAIATLAFALVILQAFSGRLSLGDVALYTSAVASVQGTLLNMALAFSQTNQSALFYRQYMNLLSLPEPLSTPAIARQVPPLSTGITLRDVSFRYSEQHPWVLRHVNLFLPAGKCLALVGLNGAGKTTLVKLLTRLYDPTEGLILWDGIDLREFEPQALRRHIGAIFQDFARYDLTIQANIGVGDVDQIEELEGIKQAAIKAGIDQHIMALPHGYQSFVGRWLAEENSGVELSGGEWQKVALARLFMRKAELLILDEPTAALDAQAEYELYTHFHELMRGSTSLLITHRFSTVRVADAVAVIENGQIIEYGTHEKLIACGGTYASLYAMQASQYK